MIANKLDGLSYLGEFRFIPGYKEQYAVSNLGFVVSFKKYFNPRLIRPNKITSGYLSYHLYYKDVRKIATAHKLVMAVFQGPRPEGKEIDHIDGDRFNNKLSNLRYVTHSVNNQHAHTLRINKGEAFSGSKLTKEEVLEIYKCGGTLQKTADKFGTTDKNISAIRRGVSWSWLTGAKKYGKS